MINYSKILNITKTVEQTKTAKQSSIHKVRAITKVPVYIGIPSVSYAFDDLLIGSGERIFLHQFNISMDANFRILNNVIYGENVNSYGVFTVKYRVGSTVKRYILWGGIQETNDDLIGLRTYLNFPVYNGEVIGKNCCFEFWLLSVDRFLSEQAHPAFKFLTSLTSDPVDVSQVEILQDAGLPISRSTLGSTFPEDLPTQQETMAWLDNTL